MAYTLLPWLDQFFTDSSGNPLTGGTVETYAAGTSAPKATWSDPAGDVLNPNPIPLGSNGRPTSGGIYGTTTEAYKIVVKNSSGVVQPCSRDNVWFPSNGSGGTQYQSGDYDYIGVVVSDDPATIVLQQGQCCIWTPTGAPADVRFLVLNAVDKAGTTRAGELDEIPVAYWSLRGTGGEFFVYSTAEDLGNGNWKTGYYSGNISTLSGSCPVSLEISPNQSLADYLNKTTGGTVVGPTSFRALNQMYSDTAAFWKAQRYGAYGRDDRYNAGIRFNWGGGLSGEAGMVDVFSGNQDATTAGAYLRVRSSGVEVRNRQLLLEQLPSGTATALVGRDTDGYLVSYPLGSGGYVSLNGHNDMGVTPWSIADDTTWANSDAGVQFDPAGAYQAHIKGNLLIDQGVSNVLTLYRQAFAVGTTQDLIFAGQNSLGDPIGYVHQHSYITDATSGSEDGEWRLQTRVAGSMVERIRANATGGILTGAWNTTGDFTATRGATGLVLGAVSGGDAYAGTTTNHDFYLKSNNVNRIKIDKGGAITSYGSLTGTTADFSGIVTTGGGGGLSFSTYNIERTIASDAGIIVNQNGNGGAWWRDFSIYDGKGSQVADFTGSTKATKLYGNLTAMPAASVTPANNGEMTFEATSNTSLKIKFKGSDGVVRSATLTLT